MIISVIIPTFNEEKNIGGLINHLKKHAKKNEQIEIIVVDGNSSDNTVSIAKNFGATVDVIKTTGRAFQLNKGAEISKGDVLYFVHADTLPPLNYISCITKALHDGYTSGCFAYKFDKENWYLTFNGFFTQYDGFYTGGGDQTLFVTKQLFNQLGGFNNDYVIMEDFEFTKRLKKVSKYVILKDKAIVSSRKYDKNSFIKVNIANIIALTLFRFNTRPLKIKSFYKRLLK